MDASMTESKKAPETVILPKADVKELERKKLGEDIAFGVQQTAACWATDFIDPVIGEKIQHRLGDAGKMPTGSTWIGEFAGDTAAFFAFLGVQKFTPGLTRALHKLSRKTLNNFFEKTAKGPLGQWANENNVAVNSPEYKAKMEEWKEFQADNIAKSSIISTASIGLNIGTQRAIGNKNNLWIIAVAKIAGAAITVASMLGLRFVLPNTTHSLDDELSTRYFSPLIHKTQKLLGAEVNDGPREDLVHQNDRKNHRRKDSHVERVSAVTPSQLAGQYGR